MKNQYYFTSSAEYKIVCHIARDMYTVMDDNGDKKTVTLNRGCLHLNNRKWEIIND